MGAEDSKFNSGSEAESFARLYEQYLPKIFQYVSYRVGDRTAAEDLTADIFNKALTNFTKFDSGKASFSTWIFSIARNTLIDYYRKRSSEQKLRNNNNKETESGARVFSASPEEELARSEEAPRLHECI